MGVRRGVISGRNVKMEWRGNERGMRQEAKEMGMICFFFFNDTATTEIYTLSLHDALPISQEIAEADGLLQLAVSLEDDRNARRYGERIGNGARVLRSEEHTSELQSH